VADKLNEAVTTLVCPGCLNSIVPLTKPCPPGPDAVLSTDINLLLDNETNEDAVFVTVPADDVTTNLISGVVVAVQDPILTLPVCVPSLKIIPLDATLISANTGEINVEDCDELYGAPVKEADQALYTKLFPKYTLCISEVPKNNFETAPVPKLIAICYIH